MNNLTTENKLPIFTSECNTLRETLATKRTELRQRERRIQESVESSETTKKKSKQLEAKIESLQNQIRLDQVCQRSSLKYFSRRL